MLVNRPNKVVCRVGDYNIIVASDNQLEQAEKFDAFCQDFKGMLMALVRAVPNKLDTIDAEVVKQPEPEKSN